MQINGLSTAQAAQSVSAAKSSPTSRASQASQPQSSLPADQLDLSPEAQALSQTQATGQTDAADGIRWDKVNALRQAIADGSYETTDRISGAVDNFLDAFV